MNPNGNEILTIPDYWRNYFTGGHSMIGNPSWTSSDPNIVRISSSNKYTCRIHAQSSASAGTEADITCTFSYWEGVVYMTYSIYWTVKIGGGTNGGGYSGTIPEFTGVKPNDDWNKSGNYSISWYKKSESEFVISNNKELAGLAYLVNNKYTTFKDKTIKLANDIDLTGKSWPTIGQDDYYFEGNFDGQGHTIYGIYIGKQLPDQAYYGFWGYLNGANIANTAFEGDVYLDDPETNSLPYKNFRVGGITGCARYTTISNCIVKMPIIFSKRSIYHTQTLLVGGIVGLLTNGTISNCSHEGDIDVRQFVEDSEPCMVGGIVGSSSSGTIEYSENISDNVYIYYPYGDQQKYALRFGGIVGENYEVKCCRSIIGKVEIKNMTRASMYFYIGGISGDGKGSITNSYSSCFTAKFDSADMWYNSGGTTYGGICAQSGSAKVTASFSNSDVIVSTNRTLLKGDDGSISFSSEQMKTPAFLEELNIYSLLEMETDPVWAQEEGEYPHIKSLDLNVTGITKAKTKSSINASIYTISGQRVTVPRKGINIIGGKKVVVK